MQSDRRPASSIQLKLSNALNPLTPSRHQPTISSMQVLSEAFDITGSSSISALLGGLVPRRGGDQRWRFFAEKVLAFVGIVIYCIELIHYLSSHRRRPHPYTEALCRSACEVAPPRYLHQPLQASSTMQGLPWMPSPTLSALSHMEL